MRICPQECVNVASRQKRWRVSEATETMRIRSEDTQRHVITGSERKREKLLFSLLQQLMTTTSECIRMSESIYMPWMLFLVKSNAGGEDSEWVSEEEKEKDRLCVCMCIYVALSKVSLCKFNFTRPSILSSVTCTCVTCNIHVHTHKHTPHPHRDARASRGRERETDVDWGTRCTNVQMVHWLHCLARFTIEW